MFSYFLGSFLPSWIRINWPDWIRIQSGSRSEALFSRRCFWIWYIWKSVNILYFSLWQAWTAAIYGFSWRRAAPAPNQTAASRSRQPPPPTTTPAASGPTLPKCFRFSPRQGSRDQSQLYTILSMYRRTLELISLDFVCFQVMLRRLKGWSHRGDKNLNLHRYIFLFLSGWIRNSGFFPLNLIRNSNNYLSRDGWVNFFSNTWTVSFCLPAWDYL